MFKATGEVLQTAPYNRRFVISSQHLIIFLLQLLSTPGLIQPLLYQFSSCPVHFGALDNFVKRFQDDVAGFKLFLNFLNRRILRAYRPFYFCLSSDSPGLLTDFTAPLPGELSHRLIYHMNKPMELYGTACGVGLR